MQSFKKIVTLLAIFCSFSTLHAQTYLNLDFETMSGDKLRKWSFSNNEALYSRDSTEKVSGNYSYKLTRTNPDPSGGFILNELRADLVKGKEIVIKAKIKTEIKNKGEANLYLIVFNKHGKILHSDDMEGMRLDRTSTWEKMNIKAKIDSNASVIVFGGAWSGGAMTAWFDDFELFIDGQKYTPPIPRTAPLKKNELAVLKKYCYPLQSFDPDFNYDADLSILKKLTKDAKIVALGEASHGSSGNI